MTSRNLPDIQVRLQSLNCVSERVLQKTIKCLSLHAATLNKNNVTDGETALPLILNSITHNDKKRLSDIQAVWYSPNIALLFKPKQNHAQLKQNPQKARFKSRIEIDFMDTTLLANLFLKFSKYFHPYSMTTVGTYCCLDCRTVCNTCETFRDCFRTKGYCCSGHTRGHRNVGCGTGTNMHFQRNAGFSCRWQVSF